MNYATVKEIDVANGVGVRVSLFVSGCTHHCPGCFNAETWDFNYGQPYTNETKEQILKALDHEYIRGLSLLGGEPFEDANRPELAALTAEVKRVYPEKDIWCYTGYDLEKDIFPWIEQGREAAFALLSNIDVLVDGEFIEAQKNLRLRFRGSENQRVIDVKKSMREKRAVWVDGMR